MSLLPLVGIVNPAADDLYGNGIDDDCDGQIDEDEEDVDGDGWSIERGDCNDGNGWVNPETAEYCDGIDNNCDGTVDEGCTDLQSVIDKVDGCSCETGGSGTLWLWLAALGVLARRRRS